MYFKNVNEKAETLIERYEGKRTELQTRLAEIDGEIHFMQSEVENDFQKAIMEDGKPNASIQTTLNSLHEEKARVLNILSKFDNLLQNALEGLREETLRDRDSVYNEIRKDEEKLMEELKAAKLIYLQLLTKYHDRIQEGYAKLLEFHEIEERLGLKPMDIRSRRLIDYNPTQDYVTGFHPIMTARDVKNAFYGELDYHAEQYAKVQNN
ncbi:hypothetical protein [Bacillus sp. BP-3]|uniref:hypothetical protein n=1 Tax=Bacillus sp. BP-3 TaxID=3022773 RepID=UPI00232BB3E0|nr:hypothetical protein [Bacillus sp. BP-3]MDC2864002.1 hypothetical protein [Bacillus sp. BP-3]